MWHSDRVTDIVAAWVSRSSRSRDYHSGFIHWKWKKFRYKNKNYQTFLVDNPMMHRIIGDSIHGIATTTNVTNTMIGVADLMNGVGNLKMVSWHDTCSQHNTLYSQHNTKCGQHTLWLTHGQLIAWVINNVLTNICLT